MTKMQKAPFVLAAAIGVTLLGSGCAVQRPVVAPGVEVRSENTTYRNEVVPSTARTQIRFLPGDFGMLAPDQAAHLDGFLARNSVSRSAHVLLSTSGGAPAADAVRDRLVAYGVPPRNIEVRHRGDYERGRVQVVDVQVDQYKVNVPECGAWPAQANFESATPGFGCSNVRALGLMVANPRDLVTGQALDGFDGQDQVGAVERYRTDKTKELLQSQSYESK